VSGSRKTILAFGVASVMAALASGWAASRPSAPLKPAAEPEVVRSPSKGKPVVPAPAEGPAPPQTPQPQALSELLIDSASEGFVELAPDAGPAGSFDLESFVQHSDNPDVDRAVLTENRFLRGHARSWQRSTAEGPHRIVASVFEFENESQAVVFLIHKREQTIREDNGERFPVEAGIGVRFVHRIDDQSVHGYTVAFHDGARVFYLGALYPSEQPADEIRALEARQRELLRQRSLDT
jgi:hypothetical protein